MKNLKFFIATLFLALAFGLVNAAEAVEYPISSGRSVQQKADSLFEMVSKELVFSEKKQQKFKAVHETVEQLNQLLKDDKMTSDQSAYVKEYIVALQSLPSSKAFKKSRCDQYEVNEKAKGLLENLCE